jgi:leucyl-tRNA synthetase
MELFNDLIAHKWQLSLPLLEMILVTLSTMAPHITSELLKKICHKQLSACSWPPYDPNLILDDTVTIVVQINGKVRAKLVVARGASQSVVEEQARLAATQWLANKKIIKTIFVEDKLISFVLQ